MYPRQENGFTTVPAEDGSNDVSGSTLSDRMCELPRRVVIAMLLFFVVLIETSRNLNVVFTSAISIYTRIDTTRYQHPQILETPEIWNHKMYILLAEIFAFIPGALLIYVYSSHKILLVSVVLTSIFHMVTPSVDYRQPYILLAIFMIQGATSVPINVAVLSIWKDWAPSTERARLVMFSFLGIFMGTTCAVFYAFVAKPLICYITGVLGLLWSLLWYSATYDTPQNDPLISEDELRYLENNIPTDVQKPKLKNVPWKSIATSIQVLIVCLIFCKMACSIETIEIAGIYLIKQAWRYNIIIYYICFTLLLSLLILPVSSILVDILIRKYRCRALIIRKAFLSGGFFLQSCLMLGTISSSDFIKAIFYFLSYILFAISVPGLLTLPLDLSPRYVTIISGIAFAFFNIGKLFLRYYFSFHEDIHTLPVVSVLFTIDGILSIIIAALFGILGDVEEQKWSLILRTNTRISSDCISYPKPDVDDDLNVVTMRDENNIAVL